MTYDKDSSAELVKRAREFAVNAHDHICHRRKYEGLPYTTHLENVVALVESVTDDPETVAAVWLHDVVEDTPAAVENIEEAFGKPVASLVESLTDVSRPRLSNRAARKEMDRRHLARASSRAKIVKLADLIDNCQDICRNDERFASVYLKEMARLLEVLQEGNADLYRKAIRTHDECSCRLAVAIVPEDAPIIPSERSWNSTTIPEHVLRHYADSFTALDVDDPMRSFDSEKSGTEVLRIMEEKALFVKILGDSNVFLPERSCSGMID